MHMCVCMRMGAWGSQRATSAVAFKMPPTVFPQDRVSRWSEIPQAGQAGWPVGPIIPPFPLLITAGPKSTSPRLYCYVVSADQIQGP